jgi:hypothetical protein
MENSHSSNIFDEAGKKSAPSKKNEAALPLEVPSMPNVTISDDQLAEMFERAKRMKVEIEEKLQEVYDKTGLTRKQVETYMKDPKNFTVQEWQNIQIGRKDWEGRLEHLMGQEYKQKRAKAVQDQSSKERKGKTLGARKNWIPMR